MKPKWTVGMVVFLAIALTGCNEEPKHTSTNRTATAENTTDNHVTSPQDDSIWVNAHVQWPSVDWYMMNQVPDADNMVLPQYNTSLALNQSFLLGRQPHPEWARYNSWRFPDAWRPYLEKNTPLATLPGGKTERGKPYLHITLQGTVFLDTRTNGAVLPMADIPVTATIVAEFVPLIPAIKAGIVPYSHSEEIWYAPLPNVWRQATRMTDEQIESYLK